MLLKKMEESSGFDTLQSEDLSSSQEKDMENERTERQTSESDNSQSE